jgi:hypothetical protein
MRNVTDYCHSKGKKLILGCDANAHILLGSANTNPRDEALMEYLVSSNLNVLSQGNESNLVVCKRNEITDFTLKTNKISELTYKWHVSDELSLSDIRYICIQIGRMFRHQTVFRGPKRMNLESYKDNQKVNIDSLSQNICMIRDADDSTDKV